MTTSFISVQNEISWQVLSAKGPVAYVDGGEHYEHTVFITKDKAELEQHAKSI